MSDNIIRYIFYPHFEPDDVYAHRSLLVWELEMLHGSKPCTLGWKPCSGGVGGLASLAGRNGVYMYVVLDPEQPASPTFPRRSPALVAVASDRQPASVSFPCDSLPASYPSSLVS